MTRLAIGLMAALAMPAAPTVRVAHRPDLARETAEKIEEWALAERVKLIRLPVADPDAALRAGATDLALGVSGTDEHRLAYFVTPPWRDHECIGAKFGFEKEADRLRSTLAPLPVAQIQVACTALAGLLGLAIVIRRMRQAERAAHRAILAKSELLANLSHELRTPLNAILGLSHLLLESRLDADQRESVQTIRAAAAELQSAVTDLLDLTALRNANPSSRAHTAFDALEAIEDATWMMRPAAAAKGLELGLRFEATAPRRWVGDGQRIRQIAIHLVSNAIKFTARGWVQIRVAAHESGFRLEVEDTGIGIPAALRQKLFDEFTTGDASPTRSQRGLGLGLALCRGWVTHMNGRIGVTSQPREGSTFWIELPLTPQPDREPAPLQGQRSLIVDDGSLAAVGLQEHLARLGCETSTVGSAPLALSLARDAALENRPYAFIFLRDGQPMDRETFSRSLRLTAESPPVLPITEFRLEELALLLSGSTAALIASRPPAQLRESLAALMAATSPAAMPCPKSGTHTARTA